MNRIYDLFELLPDGSQVLRTCTSGLDMAKLKLEELASSCENEFYAIYIPTRETVARVNVGGA
jgi:hypothetical protein